MTGTLRKLQAVRRLSAGVLRNLACMRSWWFGKEAKQSCVAIGGTSGAMPKESDETANKLAQVPDPWQIDTYENRSVHG